MDLRQCSWQIIEALIDQVQDAVFIHKHQRLIYVNQQLCDLLGQTEETLLGQSPFDFIHADDIPQILQRAEQRERGEEVEHEYMLRVISSGKDIRPVHAKVVMLIDGDGVSLTMGTLKDMTETLAYQRDLEESQREIMNILNNLPELFHRVDAQGRVTYMSPSVKEALGYTAEELYGRVMADFYVNREDREKIVKAVKAGAGAARHVQLMLRHKNGDPVWFSTNAYIRQDANGEFVGLEGISRNITAQKQLEEKLEYLANHDELTELPSRRWLMKTLKQSIQRARRYGSKVGILFCDLDGFKAINDNYSHRVGDEVLVRVADALRGAIRASDIVGRLGGDEFLVITPEVESVEDVRLVGEKLIEAIAQMQMPQGIKSSLSLSVGLASYPDNADNYDLLLSLADEAMYLSKSAGKNQLTIHTSSAT